MIQNLVLTGEGRSVLVLTDEVTGDSTLLNDTHANYAKIIVALNKGEDISELLDGTEPEPAPIEVVIANANLSAHVTIIDDVLHFDGDPRFDVLSDTIRRYHEEGRDATNLLRFMERLALNPSENSRDQLFTWTQARDLTIDPDGFIVAFKGITTRAGDQDYLDNGRRLFPIEQYPYQSGHAGHGIVDGIEVNGFLPMGVGAVIEMPRSEVQDNSYEGCSTGLHVGTYDYALGFAYAGALVEVRFDPADVVSVPSDCGSAKMRVCRYEVVAVHDLDKGDDLTDHEPEATIAEASDEAFAEFMGQPDDPGMLDRLFARLRRKDR